MPHTIDQVIIELKCSVVICVRPVCTALDRIAVAVAAVPEGGGRSYEARARLAAALLVARVGSRVVRAGYG